MSVNIQPVGKKLLAKYVKSETITRPTGIELPSSSLEEAEVSTVSDEIKHLYQPGDHILYHSKKGILEPRLGGEYLWLDAEPNKEEIWGIVSRAFKKDKGDSL